jgi:hypothetical protein
MLTSPILIENSLCSENHKIAAASAQYLLDVHQQLIQEMIEDGQTDAQIVAALFRRGVRTSEGSLRRRLQIWAIRRPPQGPEVNLVEAVNYIFHHTILNDARIAERILQDYNLEITARQVRSIRSKHGWLRASSGPKKVAQTAATEQLVHQAIFNGPGRTFGRR